MSLYPDEGPTFLADLDHFLHRRDRTPTQPYSTCRKYHNVYAYGCGHEEDCKGGPNDLRGLPQQRARQHPHLPSTCTPHNATTIELLRNKHPSEDQNTIATCKGVIFGEAQVSPVTLQGIVR